MAFSEEYLKDYKSKIHELPLEELYDILYTIRDDVFKADDSPERIKIVENRIIELTGDKDSILPIDQYRQKLDEDYRNHSSQTSFLIKIFGLLLLFAGIACISFLPAYYILLGLGILVLALSNLIDGQILLKLRGTVIALIRKDQKLSFWSLTGVFCLIGIGLCIYGFSILH
jgi:hypothetical protein